MQYEKSFRKLIAWRQGKEMAMYVYKVTIDFPSEEKFAMVSQMRRSAYSFIANIAEGNAKNTIKDKHRFFNIAQGSIVELDCFAELAFELKYIKKENYDKLLELLNKSSFLLHKLIVSQHP